MVDILTDGKLDGLEYKKTKLAIALGRDGVGPHAPQSNKGEGSMKTPSYIKALLQPNGQKAPSRRVWSIDLEATWVPFFTATNVTGETSVPSEDLGAPLRLVKAKDGSVKFTQSGRPSLKVAPQLNSHITVVRENFVATLQAYAGKTMTELKDEYRAQVEAAQKAAIPIHQAQADAIAEALALLRKAEGVVQEAEAIVEAQPEPVTA